MVNRDSRYLAVHKLNDIRVFKVNARNHNAVTVAVLTVLVVAHLELADILADKCDIEAALFRFHLKAIKDRREVFMRQAALCLINKQYTNIIRTIRFKCARRRVGQITHLFGHSANMRCCFFPNIRIPIECFADCSGRNAASF